MHTIDEHDHDDIQAALAAGDPDILRHYAHQIAERCRLRPRRGFIIVAEVPATWVEAGLGVLVTTHRRQRRCNPGLVVSLPGPDAPEEFTDGDLIVYVRVFAMDLGRDPVAGTWLVRVRVDDAEAVVTHPTIG